MNKNLVWAAVLIITLFSSCIEDSLDSGALCPSDGASTEGKVTFHINIPQSSLPSTRAIAEGSIDDNAVDEVTFLLFTPSTDGTGAYAGSAAATEIETSVSDTKLKTFTVVLPDGAYDALIIANADDAFTAFKTATPGYEAEDRAFFEANLSTIIVGGNATAGYTPWNANPTNAAYKPFPMAGRFDIPAERTSSLGTIFLTRALAKVNIKLAFDQTYAGNRQTIFRLEAVNIPHFNTKGNLIPGNPGAKALSVFDQTQLNIPATGYVYSVEKALTYTDLALMTPNAASVPEQQIIDEIFVPELIKSTDPKQKPCVLIEIWHPTLQANRWYRVDLQMNNLATAVVESINLLRNFRYSINITDITGNGFASAAEAYAAPAEGIVATISAIDESDMNDITFDGRNQLVTNASYFVFQANGPKQDLKVFTDYTGGWKVIANTASSWLTAAPALGTVGVTTPMSLIASVNTGATARTGMITIEAGALRKTIEVVQMPALASIKIDAVTTDKNFNVYVGAFWKANQTGERLIRMPRATVNPQNYDGKWVAVVVSGEDWIQMDTLMTSDANVGWRTDVTPNETSVDNGGDTGFDSRHQVISGRNWVNGTMDATDTDIYFRIGLNNHHAATTEKPVRYGMILLAYNNYTKIQRIWIRQGEEADYLMAPGDPGGSGTSVADNRSFAGKFSPYNLSDPNKNTATAYNSASLLPVNGGVFTDYPSQAGYLFTFGDTRAVYPVPAGSTYTNWPNLGSVVWNPDLLETCPPGYRRPTDSGNAAGSEIRQSWWMNPQNGNNANNVDNMVSGYYADGWFDRRAIGTSISGTASSVVASPAQNPAYTGADVAYVGVLVYNPTAGSTHYNASMFIPSGGQISSGQIKYTGANAPHWASSNNGASPGWNSGMNTKSIGLVAYMSFQNINMGLNIRCVYDPDLLPPNPVVDLPTVIDVPPSGVTPYVGAFWKAGQTGERLIHISLPNTVAYGKWTAQVLDGDKDWITVDNAKSTDTNVGWRTDVTPNEALVHDPLTMGTSFDSQHPVGGTYWVRGIADAGNPNIYFRIGLKSSIAAGSAPRYSVVVLTYGDGKYKQCIWIRQGEEADYVFRNGDAVLGTSGLTARTMARQVSPYNLTATTLNAQAGIKGAEPNAGKFTNYPSQAGAIFQYAQVDKKRWAWAPIGDITGLGWNDINWERGYWNANTATYETCPAGYHRPSDGIIDGGGNWGIVDLQQSELWQSLFLEPQIGTLSSTANSVWGYYADGFFDRRALDTSSSTAAATNVNQVAYMGRIMFNPDTYASVFLPAAGSRQSGGALTSLGSAGYYMSASITAYSVPYLLQLTNGQAYRIKFAQGNNIDPYCYGGSIRCVHD